MSVHDFDIANQTAQAARNDINLALKALASLSSSTSSAKPTATQPNMLFYNTTAHQVEIRNEAATAWLDGFYVDQTNGFSILEDTNVVNSSGTVQATLTTQPLSNWIAGTNTDRTLVSPSEVKAAIDSNAVAERTVAWVNFNGTGVVSINNSEGVSSITDAGTGKYNINYSTTLSSASHAVTMNGVTTGYVMQSNCQPRASIPMTTSVGYIGTGNTANGVFVDFINIYYVASL
tara:strand:+ start:91 stop:789 length:699 start_codon:yes stop_codon:yes gene_type:complete